MMRINKAVFLNSSKYRSIFLIFVILILFAAYSDDTLAKSNTEIVIDAGHGGIDTGAAIKGMIEKDITLDISKRVERYLAQMGHVASFTRNKDISLYKLSNIGHNAEERDLNSRVGIINKSNAKLFVSIHVNSDLSYPKENGAIVYYNSKIKGSKELAYSIEKEVNNIAIEGRRRMQHIPQESRFFILKNSRIPGVLVETAFLSNDQERQSLKTAKFRDDIAKAVAKGIENARLVKAKLDDNNYIAAAYVKNKTSADIKRFQTFKDGVNWIKNKLCNGTVSTKTLPKNNLGVVLEKQTIDFSKQYIVSKNTYKSKCDEKVRAIQKRLAELGYKLKADGFFGDNTMKAVKAFQKKSGLKDDGVVGKNTYMDLVRRR